MTVRITPEETAGYDAISLQVARKLFLADAEILKEAFYELRNTDGRRIEIDLSQISFLDDESAVILVRLQQQGAVLRGITFFVGKVIESAQSGTAE